MNKNIKNPGTEQRGPDGAEQQGNKPDLGNNLSMGSVSGAGVSDFNQEVYSPETEEQEYREGNGQGDDQRSDDNGINPTPAEVDPKKTNLRSGAEVENADEDKLKSHQDEDEKLNSTWMISGRNRKI